MLVLGFNGGTNLVHEDVFEVVASQSHDSAAVLIDDGEVVAAIEQERLDRIKHSNKLPIDAIKFCLDSYGVRADDVDAFVYYTTRESMHLRLRESCLKQNILQQSGSPSPQFTRAEEFFSHALSTGLGQNVPADRIQFVRHHVAHLVSAFAFSGFERSLLLSIDGVGEGESGRVAVADGNSIETTQVFRQDVSLGHFYTAVIRYIGFKMFDEYKAMGLAPYGDPTYFRPVLKRCYKLLPGGEYRTNLMQLYDLFAVMQPRKKGEPFTQTHMDLAAALQEILEEIVLHILRHHQKATGHTNLCLVGGVAHNCTMNGKIAASGMFENVFVQPAAHDAGCALGAALAAYYQHHDGRQRPAAVAVACPKKRAALDHLYWGTDIGTAAQVAAILSAGRSSIKFEPIDAVEKCAAALLAGGSVIGWVQGRSEFGPRALGNRSILADARPAENKDIINAMVKKREGFRPFAPSVLEEDADDYFVLVGIKDSPFMIFVVDVREDKRALLGAVTHVDGSARVQTVSRRTNPRYWSLIHEFKALTGVPVILNTSFNNHAEPIVDSTEDAVVCFLTTNLHYLIVGDHLVSKREFPTSAYGSLVPGIPRHLRLMEMRRFDGERFVVERLITSNAEQRFQRQISAEAFELLGRVNNEATLDELVTGDAAANTLFKEIADLWSARLVTLRPRA